METKEPPVTEAGGLTMTVPLHLTENFETAVNEIRNRYGLSPDVPSLMRLWLACGTSGRIRREFERAVLEIQRRPLNPYEEAAFDED